MKQVSRSVSAQNDILQLSIVGKHPMVRKDLKLTVLEEHVGEFRDFAMALGSLIEGCWGR